MTPREKILETIKEEMIGSIEKTTLHTLNETESTIQELFKYAFYLDEAINELEPTEQHTDKQTIYPIDSGRLKRTLSNGFIVTDDGQEIYIPEKIIRKYHLEHGDIIAFTPTYMNPEQPPTYDYNLIEKRYKSQDSARRVFKKAVIQKDLTLSITHDINLNPLIVDGVVKNYQVTQKECEIYNLRENDVVDIAWYQTTYSRTVRIVWKYSDAHLKNHLLTKEPPELEKTCLT